MSKKITPALETKVLALIARGDSYKDISATLTKEDDHALSVPAISLIKKKNSTALLAIQNAMRQESAGRVNRITNKANRALEDKLDNHLTTEEKKNEAYKQLANGDIEKDEYYALIEGLTEMQTKDIIAVSKESFRQAQLADGKPTNISENPKQAREQLLAFLQVINTNDAEKVHELIFGLQTKPGDIVEGEVVA